jgi:hypothetical protein
MLRRTSGCSWRSGCGRGLGLEGYDRSWGCLLLPLQIGTDLLEIEVEFPGILLPVPSDLLDDRGTPWGGLSVLHVQVPGSCGGVQITGILNPLAPIIEANLGIRTAFAMWRQFRTHYH